MNLDNFRLSLKTCNHRSLLILSGDPDWQITWIKDLFAVDERVFWVNGDEKHLNSQRLSFTPETIPSQRLQYYLGQEIDGAILDVSQGISANHLGIVSGMIRAGGFLVLLTPKIEQWHQQTNPENQRFLNSPLKVEDALHGFNRLLITTWKNCDCIWLEQSSGSEPRIIRQFDPINKDQPNRQHSPAEQIQDSPEKLTLTTDQQSALEKILTVAFGHRKRPLVISADRGRGKSSILGIGAVEALMDGKKHIVITASRLDQAEKVFEQALKWLEKSRINIIKSDSRKGEIEFSYTQANRPVLETKRLEFIAPDQLVLTPTSADLLMVDEAAFLPTPLLTELLRRHHRMVFATTLHGYEGSGRGFEIRFKKTLSELTPDWKSLHLNTPIRWSNEDPLEKSINQALLLNIQLEDLNTDFFHNTSAADWLDFIKPIDPLELPDHRQQLSSCFSLLVQAHYQTSPNDLQQLLNTPNLQVFACFHPQNPHQALGIIVAIEEGQIDGKAKNLQHHGHLVPQLLNRFYNYPTILPLKSLRIMRIAVHPQCQQSGIGKALIEKLKVAAQSQQLDYLSSSFGASDDLVEFWSKLGFQPLHLSSKRDKASGHHNLVVIDTLTAAAQKNGAEIQQIFQQQLPHQLIENLPFLSPKMVWRVFADFRFRRSSRSCYQSLMQFAQQTRSYDSISYQLWENSQYLGEAMLKLPLLNQSVWCDKILKKHSWQKVAHQYHLAGRKAVEQVLFETAQMLVEQLGYTVNNPIQREIDF